MRRITLSAEIEEFADLAELPTEQAELLNRAAAAAQDAYAPYSHFRVGAAALLANGVVVIGSNQENAAFPSGLCAERVALFSASANYPGVPVECLAICASSEAIALDTPVSPCGACRQVMVETEHVGGRKMTVLLRGETGPIYRVGSSADLLPLRFLEDGLKR